MEPTLFGIGKAEWELYNSFSNWLSALATLAAVLVSLHLARRSGEPRAVVSAGHRLIVTPGESGKPPEIVVIRIVNTGDRTIRIVNIGWQVGFRTKRHAMQMHDSNQSSPLPVELAHGQEAQWTIPLLAGDRSWLVSFASKMLKPHLALSCYTLRVQVYTSVGKVFKRQPERSLLERLRKAGAGGAVHEA